jgi:hypothetical protein
VPEGLEGSLDVWLHFDAKYRIDRAREQFDAAAEEPESAAAEAEIVERFDRSKREDLLKMHAYRDAIRGSAGAYVLFPGDFAGAPFREFAEPLPGLGAFALRPNDSGQALGREALEHFIDGALRHVADRASQDERYRYWRGVIRGRPEPTSRRTSFPQLQQPPRDARVICSWRCSRQELEWISRMRTLAFPLDDPGTRFTADLLGLGADWAFIGSDEAPISLWERESAWFVQNRVDLALTEYPSPAAEAYMCAVARPVHSLEAWMRELGAASLRHLDPTFEMVIVTWADLLEAANSLEDEQ